MKDNNIVKSLLVSGLACMLGSYMLYEVPQAPVLEEVENLLNPEVLQYQSECTWKVRGQTCVNRNNAFFSHVMTNGVTACLHNCRFTDRCKFVTANNQHCFMFDNTALPLLSGGGCVPPNQYTKVGCDD